MAPYDRLNNVFEAEKGTASRRDSAVSPLTTLHYNKVEPAYGYSCAVCVQGAVIKRRLTSVLAKAELNANK